MKHINALLAIGCYLTVWVLLILPGNLDLPPTPNGLDLVIHAAVFFMIVAFWHRWSPPSWRLGLAVIIGTAVATECVQAWFIPGRSGDWRDGLADLFGGGVALIISYRLRSRLSEQPNQEGSSVPGDIRSVDAADATAG